MILGAGVSEVHPADRRVLNKRNCSAARSAGHERSRVLHVGAPSFAAVGQNEFIAMKSQHGDT
jgi:hypothetical protein